MDSKNKNLFACINNKHIIFQFGDSCHAVKIKKFQLEVYLPGQKKLEYQYHFNKLSCFQAAAHSMN